MISLITDPSLVYPDASAYFSPDEAFPEYAFEHLSSTENPVYRAVRRCFSQAGLDKDHFGQPGWNPLGDFIAPGSRVFILCNFANERRHNERLIDFQSRCTHGSVLRPIIDYVLLAVGKTGSVSFGNAPTQFADWSAVQNDTGANAVHEFYESRGIPVTARDLRLFVTVQTVLGAIRQVERRDESDGVAVRLDSDSLFSELDRQSAQRYRIMNYNPKRTDRFHCQGSHTYIVNRHILEADVILSVPKFKTHEKVGISSALKGFVGTVGHKDSLPHHRYGPPEKGGDEYPDDKTHLLGALSALHERVQQTKPDSWVGSAGRVTYRVTRRILRDITPGLDGAWWGNDTAWRMVLDLVRIGFYTNVAGEMQNTPQRRHLAFIDGVLGGEGEGPAYPTALHSGLLMFGDNLAAVDWVNALMMGFDPERIPLIREAFCISKYPLAMREQLEELITYNGDSITLTELGAIEKHHFEPPPGWRGKL